jgi:hypothetical protein
VAYLTYYSSNLLLHVNNDASDVDLYRTTDYAEDFHISSQGTEINYENSQHNLPPGDDASLCVSVAHSRCANKQLHSGVWCQEHTPGGDAVA